MENYDIYDHDKMKEAACLLYNEEFVRTCDDPLVCIVVMEPADCEGYVLVSQSVDCFSYVAYSFKRLAEYHGIKMKI